MKLKTLTIDLQPSYAKNAGKYEGKFEYEGERGGVTLLLDHQVSEALLACIGDVITKFATKAAEQVRDSLIQSVAEAKASPQIEVESTT